MTEPASAWTVHTDVFDGPLDLLLYLVERDGIDLTRLDVRQVTDSYLAYLDRMRDLNLSLAGDYLLMAATLVHLKSLELLPRPPTATTEDEVDPREALARQLRDYAKVRARADALETRPLLGRDTFTRAAEDVAGDDRLVAGLDAFALLDLYHELLARRDEAPPTVTLAAPGLDFRGSCQHLLTLLGGPGGKAELGAVLRALPTRGARVVVFVATLEMTRQGWVIVRQAVHLGPVEVEQLRPESEIDLEMLGTRVATGATG